MLCSRRLSEFRYDPISLLPFLVQPVHFDQRDTDRVVLAAHDRGVISRCERRDDGALKIIGRRKTGGLNLGFLAVSPVVVKGDDGAIPIMQLQGRIGQRIGNAILGQGGANGAHDYSLLSAASNNKAADHDIVAGLDKGARGDVAQLRRPRGRTHQVVADDVEVNAFWRSGSDIGKLTRTNRGILHIRIRLWARGAQPIPEIVVRVLIEADDIGVSTVYGKIARATGRNVPGSGSRPAE